MRNLFTERLPPGHVVAYMRTSRGEPDMRRFLILPEEPPVVGFACRCEARNQGRVCVHQELVNAPVSGGARL